MRTNDQQSRTILHIDFNSYFATIEQQANPRLRGKPIGVAGGDRDQRTVICTASVEAKKRGVKTGTSLREARQVCPDLIIVPGESEKYLECSKRFLNILKDYSPLLEVFSIDESFLQLADNETRAPEEIGEEIKDRIRKEIGDWVTCSIGISYNKLMAKLASDFYKPDGMMAILDQQAAMMILDHTPLSDICGIGYRIDQRLRQMGVTNFTILRQMSLESLLAGFKSYGQVLYNMARGIDHTEIVPFYEKEEVKSVGHRHTIDHDTTSLLELEQIFLKLTELIGRRLRAKRLKGKTVSIGFRRADFTGDGKQVTIPFTDDGMAIFEAVWKAFRELWHGEPIRLLAATISNLIPANPQTLTFLEDDQRHIRIIKAMDKVNNTFGEFTVQRAVLLKSTRIVRKANPFLSDRRFSLKG